MASHDAIGESEQTRSLRAPSSEPSLTQRDVIGAQNRSPSRKRPRLDSGSRVARSLSADRALSSLDKAATVDGNDTTMDIDSRPLTPHADEISAIRHPMTPSRVTINVREPPKESVTPNGHHAPPSGHSSNKHANGMNGHAVVTNDSMSGSPSPKSASSPVIEVTAEHSDDNPDIVTEIHLEGEDSAEQRIAELFRNFPFATDGAYEEAAELIADEQTRGLNFEVLLHFDKWVQELQACTLQDSSMWGGIFYEHAAFWETVAKTYHRVFHRSILKPTNTASADAIEPFARAFLNTFAHLLARVIEVDADFFPDEQMDVDRATLLAPKFLGAARPILREDKGFLAKVLPNLGIDANELRAYVIKCFVEADGPRHLAKMIRANLNQACRDDFLLKMVTFVEFAQTIGVYAVFYHDKRDALTQPQSENLAEGLLDIFDVVDKQLLCSLDKQQDILSVETRRTLFDFQSSILGSLFRLTPDKTHELFLGILGDDTVVSEDLDGQDREVAIVIWKLKLMIAYMTKARMDLRVQGVDIMARELVDFFTTNKSKGQALRFSDPHPVLCFVADFLLKQKVTEYLLGVASHPQLLSRCSNVIGFLVVTNKFSRDQAQLIWRTIKDSQDPRVVNASIPILTHLTKQLTEFEENVMFAELALSEPLPPMNIPAIDFFLELLAKLRQGLQDYHFQTQNRDNAIERFYRMPLEFAIELICAMSPTMPQLPNSQIVYDHAAEVLSSLASITPLNVRKAIFEKCIANLTSGQEDGAATAHSINSILRHLRPLPKEQINELRLATILMQEFCRFVSSKREGQVRMNQQLMNLELIPRLDLIWLIVPLDDANDIDEQLLKQFWSHLVGADALNNAARDVAWHRLAIINFTAGMDSGFLERHKHLLSPTEIDSNLLTAGFFQFAQKLSTAQIRMQAIPEFAEDGSLKIAGLDLIWNAILRAPKAVNDEAPLQYLVTRYLDPTWFHRASKTAIEKTHVAMVQDNIKRLKSAFATIRQSESHCNDEKDSGTGILMSAEVVEEAMLTFLRVMKFLRKFLLHVRTSKDYRGQGTVTIDMTDDAAPPRIRGDPLSIKCDIMRGGQKNITRTLALGSQDTCKQLYTRVCMLLGEYNVASFQVITGGKRCYLREQPRMTLEDFGIVRTPHLIIREANSSDDARKDHIVPSPQWRSAFEHELVNHINVLYDFMDGSDMASVAARDLLKSLPRYQALSDAISNKTASHQDLFPLPEPCKAFYSIDTIRELLEAGSVDNAFLVYAVQVLECALPTEDQLAQRLPLHIELISETVSCLYDLFLASGNREQDLFSDVASAVRRLISLCALTIPLAQHGGLTWDSYELTIDLLSSRQAAWNEFISHPQVAHVHESLFLTHPEAFVRRFAFQLIQRKLTQWQPSEGVSLATFVLFAWNMIAERIPLVVAVPQKAAESFDIALLLYKILLASDTLSEQQVIGPFRSWGTLILRHQHHESVGRDDPDSVLRGLATLMLCTVKRFPKVISPPEKVELIQAIWWRFLFQRAPKTDAEASLAAKNLPALETNTRMELVLLIAELATDGDSIAMMGGVLDQLDIRPVDRQTDRTGFLRSAAGYVGLTNLGQTCYMNSLVTQLFMNPILRAFILSCAPVTVSSKSPLLYETQRLFATMQSGFSGYANGSDFTSKIAMMGNEKIDVRDQMDVDEFMNLLFNRWEEQMPSSELKERLLSIYRSTTIQQIKSKECEHVSEKEEVLMAIPCDVQGNTDLESSLRGFVQGDVMEGANKYKCERCDRKVDAVKRTCLKDLPDHLMIQLKRFAFDMDVFQRVKVNDHFAFPLSIDMSPYSFRHLANPDEHCAEDIFDLVGVVVHKGQAEHGHYVSYIRARPTPHGEEPTWLLFDDSDVSFFDPKDLGDACFGGYANKESGGFFNSGQKSYNAYMLFYQRRSSLQQHPWTVGDSPADLRDVPITADMESEILQKNRELLKRYSLFDESSREYVRCLISKLEKLDHDDLRHELHSKLLSAIWTYMTHIWVRTKDYPGFEEALKSLRALGARCPQCCYSSLMWFIKSQQESRNSSEDILRDMLLRINQPKIRGYFRSFFLESIMEIRDNTAMYGADVSEIEPALTGRGAIVILTRLAHFIPKDIHHNLRAWEDFFGLLADVANLGPQESYALIADGVLTACFDALLCGTGFSSLADAGDYQDVAHALKRKGPAPYSQLIRLTAALFEYIDMQRESVPDEEAVNRLEWHGDDGVPWTDYEERALLDFNKKEGGLLWLAEVLQKWDFDTEGFAPGGIVKCLLHAKSSVVHGVVETFTTTIHDFEPRYADPFLRSAMLIPMHLDRRDLMEQFLKFMNQCSRHANPQDLRGEDGYNGAYCHKFWSAVHQIAMGNLESRLDDQAFFDRHFITTSREWGPVLLAYTRDWEVGRLTQRLLSDAIFNAGQKLIDIDVRNLNDLDDLIPFLFWGCDRQVRMFQMARDPPWQQFMTPICTIMAECVQYIKQEAEDQADQAFDLIDEDRKIFERFEEVKGWYDSLQARLEHEVAQPSELLTTAEWEGLDVADDTFADASDLTEISDDEVGSLLTTN